MYTVLRNVFKFLYYFFTLRITKVYVISIVIVILSASVAEQYKTFVRSCPISCAGRPLAYHLHSCHMPCGSVAHTCHPQDLPLGSTLFIIIIVIILHVCAVEIFQPLISSTINRVHGDVVIMSKYNFVEIFIGDWSTTLTDTITP